MGSCNRSKAITIDWLPFAFRPVPPGVVLSRQAHPPSHQQGGPAEPAEVTFVSAINPKPKLVDNLLEQLSSFKAPMRR